MKIRITHQGQLVKITPRASRAMFPRRYGRGNRNITTHFSDRSRKNLLEHFAIIDKGKAKNATFITLTYVENQRDHRKAQRDIDTFIKRLCREKDNIFGVWKKELQKRGAIHFHLMVWNLPFVYKAWCAYTWGEITGSWDTVTCDQTGESEKVPPFTRIEYCKSQRKAWYYLAKYIGKVDKNGESQHFNNETGEITNKTVKATTIDEGELTQNPQLTRYNPVVESREQILVGLTSAQIPPQEKSTGRWWGWFGRKNIPLAQKVETELEVTWEEYRRYRIDLRRVEHWTSEIHLSHTVKMFWFHENIDPIMMLIRGKIGEKVFDHADKWVRT